MAAFDRAVGAGSARENTAPDHGQQKQGANCALPTTRTEMLHAYFLAYHGQAGKESINPTCGVHVFNATDKP